MKLNQIYILFIIFIFSCQTQEDKATGKETKNTETFETQDVNSEDEIEQIKQLTIEGKNIWVRETPTTGDVIMKLNTGDVCKILEKGEEVQVKNMLDKWYKIEFNDTIGWVFGSQTNLKTGKTIKIDDIKTTLKEFAKSLKNQNFSKFIHKDLGIKILHNPGVFCILDTVEAARIPITQNLNLSEKDIFNKKPDGNFCDTYSNIKDGLYYWKIKKKDLPVSADMTDAKNVKSIKLKVPDKYKNNTIYKVQIIKDEYHNSYFFFINIGKTWYLLCEDYCDCSA